MSKYKAIKYVPKCTDQKLTAKYALLNKIGVTNWVPTSHTFEHPDICTATDVSCAREIDLPLDFKPSEGDTGCRY
ncbi:hypothetical protein L195_g047537 [Trifolium pratense]|uniref:Uncharacterized protein n=1 Tax=Trifolium pratense TaxID=57577 RepID=A0A2K3MKV1_TRIPR|nr:hypothetical protein L195_g047537 [Trifolium pratense]